METTEKRRPGRPSKFGEPLDSREILVPRSVDAEAQAIAEKRNVSISHIYREWIERGRKAKGRKP